MGVCFSDEVEQALRYIYYDLRAGKGKEGFALLEKASAAGDGDASCILGRCYCGPQYVWGGHGFPEDDHLAVKLMHQSVAQGSALGVLVSMRMGELTPSVEKKMPFASIQEAFDIVLQKAEAGDAFCQYTVGNTYFWWDFLRIQGKGQDSFPNAGAYKAYLKENIQKCEGWFQKAYRGGIYFAANNLNHFYTEGDEDIILPQPEKAADIYKSGAEMGYPPIQNTYAKDLKEAGKQEEALYWFKQAAEAGHPGAWYEVGAAYFNGAGVSKDAGYAVSCFERELAKNPIHTGSCNLLGKAYFFGDGVPQDYAKAYQLLATAYYKQDSTWGVYYLAKCSFKGWGTPQDYTRTMEFLNKMTFHNPEADYMRGFLHARGLGGVPEDIKKGVEYLKKAEDVPEAKAELLNYRKTLFGKWVRR